MSLMFFKYFLNNNKQLSEFQKSYNSAYYQSLADTYQQSTCASNIDFSITWFLHNSCSENKESNL